MAWHVVSTIDDDLHVVPVGDARPHELTMDCPCGPIRDPLGDAPHLVVHGSFDGREALEPDAIHRA